MVLVLWRAPHVKAVVFNPDTLIVGMRLLVLEFIKHIWFTLYATFIWIEAPTTNQKHWYRYMNIGGYCCKTKYTQRVTVSSARSITITWQNYRTQSFQAFVVCFRMMPNCQEWFLFLNQSMIFLLLMQAYVYVEQRIQRWWLSIWRRFSERSWIAVDGWFNSLVLCALPLENSTVTHVFLFAFRFLMMPSSDVWFS